MKDRKITVMFPVNNLGAGGAERQLLELVKGLDKAHFNPIVLTLYQGYTLEGEAKDIPGAELISVDRKTSYNFWCLAKIYNLLRRKKVDIIQPFLTPATFFGLMPAMLAHTPVRIATERSGIWASLPLGHKIYQKAEDSLTRFADWAVPNSEAGKNMLVKRGINPERIKVIYNGINLERLQPEHAQVDRIRRQIGLTPGGNVVGITASLTPAKDLVTFLKMARIVFKEMPETRFAILGDGELKNSLRETARELGLESCVTFFGRQQDVGSYVSAFDVFCLSSVDHEGCSNATLEAMALGKPVVITDIGGNREIVENGKTGIMVPVRNPEALAEGVLTCLKEKDTAAAMAVRARNMVLTRFSLSRMVHDYEQLYEQSIELKKDHHKQT